MFFLKEMERVVTLPPQFFGPALRETLERKLVDEVEGTCSGRFGYVVLVQDVSDIGQGRIQDGASGGATFSVKYTCLAFKPFKVRCRPGARPSLPPGSLPAADPRPRRSLQWTTTAQLPTISGFSCSSCRELEVAATISWGSPSMPVPLAYGK